MSEANRSTGQDYSVFDRMSTEELNEYLRKDSYKSSDESNMDEILYVMEVLAKREEQDPTCDVPDVQAAWASFIQNYYTEDGDGKSLYDFDDEDDEPEPAPKRRSWSMKPFISAAAAVFIILIGSITANARGFNVLDAITAWTLDTFSFVNTTDIPAETPHTKQIPDELYELDHMLRRHGLPNTLLPSYIPKGYKVAAVKCEELPDNTTIVCQLSNGSNSIILTYDSCSPNSLLPEFQKDSDAPEEYEHNGTVYYIMTNMENYLASWLSGDTVCSIFGVQSHNELIKIIDSIDPN